MPRRCGSHDADGVVRRHARPSVPSQSSRTKVTFMMTRNSVISPPSTAHSCSLIQTPLMFFRVLMARCRPLLIASSKLVEDDALISVTFATDIAYSFAPASCGRLFYGLVSRV